MKNILILIAFLTTLGIYSQSPVGAWERLYLDENGTEIRSVVVFSEKFQAISMFNSKSGEFIYSNGGTWELNGNMMTEKVEFDTQNSERVGEIATFKVEISEDKLSLPDSDWHFFRIDDGSPGKLNGAWLMSGRYKNGEKQVRNIDRPRKTMKILSGSRFQWIAYNTTTKQFMGTGGGTYKTIDGKYTEQIEFFSRDNSRVGAKLGFEYKLHDGEWNHMGFSSKGDPLHEIWIQRE